MLSISEEQEVLWAVGAFECQISPHQPGLQTPLTDLPYEEPYLHPGRSSPGLSIPLLGLGRDLGSDKLLALPSPFFLFLQLLILVLRLFKVDRTDFV